MKKQSNAITFLGTAGARYMVSKQILASGGAWLSLCEKEFILDPGPGSLVKAINKKLDPAGLDAIILSHKHIDHSVDINIMIESMTNSGLSHRGIVFAPYDALNGEAVILPYLRSYPESIEILSENKSYHVGDVTFSTPVRHHHPVETYGFVFNISGHTFSWIIDTGYFNEITDYYKGELLIINVVLMEPKTGIGHLSVSDVKTILTKIKPDTAIITHFGTGIWKANPIDIAQRLTDETGVNVIAARDGMKFDIDAMEIVK
jgi:ribonuclease BN (tRNA processing enzyme)